MESSRYEIVAVQCLTNCYSNTHKMHRVLLMVALVGVASGERWSTVDEFLDVVRKGHFLCRCALYEACHNDVEIVLSGNDQRYEMTSNACRAPRLSEPRCDKGYTVCVNPGNNLPDTTHSTILSTTTSTTSSTAPYTTTSTTLSTAQALLVVPVEAPQWSQGGAVASVSPLRWRCFLFHT